MQSKFTFAVNEYGRSNFTELLVVSGTLKAHQYHTLRVSLCKINRVRLGNPVESFVLFLKVQLPIEDNCGNFLEVNGAEI